MGSLVPVKPGLRRRLAERFVPDRIRSRMNRIGVDVGPMGVDPFGFEPSMAKYAATPVEQLYRKYFRVIPNGIENVPEGRVLLVANHSGQLPFDAMMIGAALFLDRDPPRFVRSMIEKWIPRLPYVSVLMARIGQIVGTPDNCRRLLNSDEAILVFPEGARGISKTFDRRYQLGRFGTGFMRLALETNTPIVPVAVVGAEEQAPAIYDAKPLAKFLGMPAFPITPTFPLLGPLGLLPLPTRYRIYFGEPIKFEGHGDEEDEIVQKQIDRVKREIKTMIDRGLSEREGIFR